MSIERVRDYFRPLGREGDILEFPVSSATVELAAQAAEQGDVPVGCVIVRDGEIVGEGRNRREENGDATAHAEVLAIEAACRRIGDWRLDGCDLYVTLEPCPMCAGAIVQARIPRVVIGSMNPKAGCAGSVLNVLQTEGFNHQVTLETGVLGAECSEMLSSFFKELRKLKKARKKEKDQSLTEK